MGDKEGHSAIWVANVILHKMDNKLTPLQLNKLIYFSHGWFLGLYDKMLILDNVEAWKYGPVISSIYYTFRDNGPYPIHFHDYFDKVYTGLNDKENDIVNQVIEGYGSLSGPALIDLTHEIGTPWEKYYDGSFDVVIPNSEIRDYFKNQSIKNDRTE